MTTIHDEEKIKELVSKYCLDTFRFVPDGISVSAIRAMQEYAEYIRQKTIDECIACVPNMEDAVTNPESWTYDMIWGYKTCKEATISKIEQLKK